MKICLACKEEKPLSEFHKHKGMSDGHVNKCKICSIQGKKITKENTGTFKAAACKKCGCTRRSNDTRKCVRCSGDVLPKPDKLLMMAHRALNVCHERV